MKEVDSVGDGVLDQHAAGVAVDQVGYGLLGAVGEQQDGLVVAEVAHRDLAHFARAEAGQGNALLQDEGVAVAAPDVGQPHALPSRRGLGGERGEDVLGAAAESEEADAELVQLGEVGVGGEGGVEDEFAWVAAGAILPGGGEAQDFVVLVGLAHGGVGVAEHTRVGVAGQEGEHALLAAAALGDVVFLDEGVVAMVGDGVEVEVEGLAAGQAEVVEGIEPQSGEAVGGPGVDAAGVCGEGGALGDGVQAAEEGQAGVEGIGADMRLASDAVELEGEQGEDGGACRDEVAAGHAGLAEDGVEGEAGEAGSEQEESAEGGAEGAGAEVGKTAVGEGSGERAGGEDLLGRAAGELGDADRVEGLGDEGLADGEAFASELVDDLEDRELAFAAEGEDALVAVDGGLGRGVGLASGNGRQEEVAVGAVAEVAAEVAEGLRGVAELLSGLLEGEAVDGEGAESLVLAVVGVARLEEEGGEV